MHNLADREGIKYDIQKLDSKTEKIELMRGTRSALATKQFIDGIVAGNIVDIQKKAGLPFINPAFSPLGISSNPLTFI